MAILLMALDTGRGIVSMAGVAVGRPKCRGVLHVELAERAALEAGVAGFAFTKGLAQRASGDPGNVTGFAVIISEVVMVYVSIAGTVTEIMHHLAREIRGNNIVALDAGRCIVSVAGVAVAGSQLAGMPHM